MADPEFYCCTPIERTGLAIFTHLIRALGDPDRKAPRGAGADTTPGRTIRKMQRDWGAEICALLADGVPRTFNRIGVELVDHTADVLFNGPVDRALWQLVEEGRLEHTMEAPILFRLAAGDCG